MNEIRSLAYTFLIGDLLHYGHLRLLQRAREVADYHVCGVVSDAAAREWQTPVVSTYDERKMVIESLNCVDEVVCQETLDPTANLRRLHERFPGARMMLFRSHHAWGRMPGVEYVRQIGGEVIRPEYHPRLSRDRIAKSFFDAVVGENGLSGLPSTRLRLGNVAALSHKSMTKAETLTDLKPVLTKARIEELLVLSADEWRQDPRAVAGVVKRHFGKAAIVVRSSCQDEDSALCSRAGAYASVLNIPADDEARVAEAIASVVSSYETDDASSPDGQILIQHYTCDVVISGVVFTRNLETNTPYYLINYDETPSVTDAVTSGRSNKKIEILRGTSETALPPRWRPLLGAVREIEDLLEGLVLDIEFAITGSGEVVIFQVRPLAANSRLYSLHDDDVRTAVTGCKEHFRNLKASGPESRARPILSDMAFWNPAELIGDRPSYLACSLFHDLIMERNWNTALLPLGYTAVSGSLMEVVAGKPYIDARRGFHALLPSGLPGGIKGKLLRFYTDRLRLHPDLHDKVEFEIVHNCFDFRFDRDAEHLRQHGFTADEVEEIRKSLLELTRAVLDRYDAQVAEDMAGVRELVERQAAREGASGERLPVWESLRAAHDLLSDCRKLGIPPFVRAARMAFLGKRLLTSAAAGGAVEERDCERYLGSIPTVASAFRKDVDKLRAGSLSRSDFLQTYGHLRPDTYDITRLPYRKAQEYLAVCEGGSIMPARDEAGTDESSSMLRDALASRLSPLCREAGLPVEGDRLLRFVATAIQLREQIKFEYTRSLSAALELVAEAGEELGFRRDEVAYLDRHSLFIGLGEDHCSRAELTNIWRNLVVARTEERRVHRLVSLPPLIFSEEDFEVGSFPVCRPNFVTESRVVAAVRPLEEKGELTTEELSGKIVVLEKADPGYDWIFTHGIAGLVTKYGGAASHMTIRCAEFRIPAAIGCGELLYARVARSERVRLDCLNRRIDVVSA